MALRIIEYGILVRMKKEVQKMRKHAITAVERTTNWVGSTASLVLHTIVFIGAFLVGVTGIAEWSMVLLVLTTAVSLEAIYLAIFIQMTVNEHTRSLRDVQEDIDEIEEDIDEIQEDVEGISEEEARDTSRKKSQVMTLQKLSQELAEVKELLQKTQQH